MRKTIVVLAGLIIVAAAAAGFYLMRSGVASAGAEVSEKAAQELQAKIDDIKKTAETGNSNAGATIEVSDTELESYVLFSLREQIPVQMDAIDVQLTPGAVASDTQMTFGPNSTGNPVVDALMAGTHNLYVKGRLSGTSGRGKFELDEIRVDGIPVPRVLVESLFNKYVKPQYPDADLKEPFDFPWGIEELMISEGKATIKY